MKKMIRWILCGAAILWGAGLVRAAEGDRLFHVINRLSVGYDDNVTQAETDEVDSVKVMEDFTLVGNRTLERGFWSLQYRTLFTAYGDREEDSNDWDHFLDATLNWDASPRINLGLTDSFVYRDSAEVFGSDGTLRQDDDTYYYNSVNGTVSAVLTPSLRSDVSGRYQFLRYDDTGLSMQEDYDVYAAGLTLRKQQTTDMSWFGEFRYETTDYTDALVTPENGLNYYGSTENPNIIPDRGFDVFSAGLGLEKVFTARLNGMLRGGYMLKNFNAANSDEESSPYGETVLSYAASEETQFAVSAVYSLYQSGIQTYAGQDRLSLALSLSHELTAKISMYAGVTYMDSQYDADNSVDTVSAASVVDGSEDALGAYFRLSYAINRSNWLEAGYSFTDFTSDLQRDFTRNNVDLAWKTRL